MTAIIVSGHGHLSTGLLDAFQMIFGKDEKIVAIPFLKGEGIPQLQEKFQQQLEQFPPEEEVLFMVDVFGGTPYNSATQLVFDKKNMDIVTGVNLPVLLEAGALKEALSISDLIGALKTINQESFKVFSEQIKVIQEQETEDDDLL